MMSDFRETVEAKILYILLTYKKELIQTPESESAFDVIKKHALTWENFKTLSHQLIFKAIQNQISFGLGDINLLNIVEYRPKEFKIFPQQANEFYSLVITLLNTNYAPFSDLEKLVYKLKDYNLNDWWMFYGQKIMSTNFEVNSIVDFGNNFVEEYTSYYNKLMSGISVSINNKDEEIELKKKFDSHLSGVSHDVPVPSVAITNFLKGGWTAPDLIIIGARPSMGKTSFTLAMLFPSSYTHDILLWTLEVTKIQIMNKFASRLTSIPFADIKHGKITAEQYHQIISAYEHIRTQTKMHIVDSSMINNLEELKIHARKLHRQGKLKMIAIDYLQLIKIKENKNTREQEIAYISRELKLLAIDLNVPVIALSQLKRPQEGGRIHMPRLTDLRESGAIEQDADIVAFLHREFYYQDKSIYIPYEQEYITDVIFAKGRDLGTALIKVFNDVLNLTINDI